MPKSRMSKSSSSTSKRKARAGRARQKRAKAGDPKFSILKFKFAVPSSLNTLLRLAACIGLLAQFSVQAGPGSLWKEDSSRSMFADQRARAVGDIITILVQENSTATKEQP